MNDSARVATPSGMQAFVINTDDSSDEVVMAAVKPTSNANANANAAAPEWTTDFTIFEADSVVAKGVFVCLHSSAVALYHFFGMERNGIHGCLREVATDGCCCC